MACAVILRPGAGELSTGELVEFCRKHLADYKIPQKIFYLTDLPRNPGGKVIKSKLIEQVLGRSPQVDPERR